MFLGRAESTIDEKGRINFPTRFREILADGAVIAKGFDKNLIIMPLPRWQKLKEYAATLPLNDPDARTFKRQLFSLASEVTLDSAGRFIIPPWLKSEAQITDSVVFACVADDIEVWNPELLAEQDQSMEDPEIINKRYEAFNLII
jgi:MraZ protein